MSELPSWSGAGDHSGRADQEQIRWRRLLGVDMAADQQIPCFGELARAEGLQIPSRGGGTRSWRRWQLNREEEWKKPSLIPYWKGKIDCSDGLQGCEYTHTHIYIYNL
jgi:hypothetical protein